MALEGETLKGWKIGKKLGAGACSDVYAVEPVAPLNDKKCDAFVMKISPLVEIDAAKAKNKKRKKSAAERNADALYAEHLMYQSHLRDHDGLPYIPPGAYGEDKGYRFLVMERLGRTLADVLKENGPIPSSTAAQIGLSLLDTLEYIHSKNIVYVDVKPENFMLDRHHENRVYFVDFGIADRYIMATGKHKEFKTGTVVGTPTFLSLECHGGATASRRDDVEALVNVLIFLIRGNLPWERATSDAEGAKLKKDTSVDDLCKGIPSEWAVMLKKARQVEFEDKPDYEFFSKALVKLGAKPGATQAFVWGSKKSKATSGSATAAPAAASPARKKSRSEEKSPVLVPSKSSKPAAKATKKPDTNPTPKDSPESQTKRPAARASASPASPARPAKKQAESDSDEEPHAPKTEGKDPRRRRKAAAKAVAAAAAAAAAAKQAEGTGRYSLRSHTSL